MLEILFQDCKCVYVRLWRGVFWFVFSMLNSGQALGSDNDCLTARIQFAVVSIISAYLKSGLL